MAVYGDFSLQHHTKLQMNAKNIMSNPDIFNDNTIQRNNKELT